MDSSQLPHVRYPIELKCPDCLAYFTFTERNPLPVNDIVICPDCKVPLRRAVDINGD